MQTICVFGASGAIGGACIAQLAIRYPEATIYAVSRISTQEKLTNTPANNTPDNTSDNTTDNIRIKRYYLASYDETNLGQLAERLKQFGSIDMVFVATGILHAPNLQPEKSMRALDANQLQQVFQVNTIIPSLIAKFFIPLLTKKHRTIFAALSARVGSISDNRLGGWYAYRASKAALNMILKTLAVEAKRSQPQAIIVGLHPGTVDSALSQPFQANVPPERLFTPIFSAQRLLEVLDQLSIADSGKCFAWDGQEIMA